jgi:hypothetical protein
MAGIANMAEMPDHNNHQAMKPSIRTFMAK